MSATPLDSKQNDMLYSNQELPNALTSLFYLQLLLRSESAPKVRENTTAPPEVEGEFDKQESTVRQRQQTAGEAAEAAARAEMEARGETRADTPSARQFTSPLLTAYVNRAPFSPRPQGHLRDIAYPAPPPETDTMCVMTPPQAIPPPQGALKTFIDSLLNAEETALKAGRFSNTVPEALYNDYHYLNEYRAKFVRDSHCFAWAGWAFRSLMMGRYSRFAWGSDEVKPISGGRNENWSGIGMSLLDGIDTLEILGLHKEFEKAAEWVEKKSNFDLNRAYSVFETNIRVVGGLLSAYDLTKRRMFLDKALDIGSRLLPAFNTPSGYPRVGV